VATYSKQDLENQQQSLKNSQKELDIAKDAYKLAKDRGRLTNAHRDAVTTATLQMQNSKDTLQDIIDLRKQESALQEEAIADSERYRNSLDKLGNSLDNNILRSKADAQLQQDKIAYIKDQLKLGKISAEDAAVEIQNLEKQIGLINKKQSALAKVNDRIKNSGIGATRLGGILKDIGTAFMKGGLLTGFQYLSALIGDFILGLVGKLFNKIKSIFVEMDEAINSFERATGMMGRQFTDSLNRNFMALKQFGMSMKDVSEQTLSLINNTSDFTLMAEAQRDALVETGGMLSRVGVAADDFAIGIQNSMKMFGQSASGASNTAGELVATAQALGVPAGQLASDFANLGGSLAKMGSQGTQAFKELARVSKLTGLEMQKILNLTDKFDTFEGAAEMTGQLNAALGGNFVNAMDMMMTTDPVQRFEQLRDAIMSTGLTFDDMSYYQRQFYANAMGLESVGDLALMMSGNFDTLSGATQQSSADYEEQARQAQATMSLQEKFNAIIYEMTPDLLELMDAFHEMFEELRNNDDLIDDLKNALFLVADAMKFLVENAHLLKYAFYLSLLNPILKFLPVAKLTVTGLKAIGRGFLTMASGLVTKVIPAIWAAVSAATALQLATGVGIVAGIAAIGYAIYEASNSPTFDKTLQTLPGRFDDVTSAVSKVGESLNESGGQFGQFASSSASQLMNSISNVNVEGLEKIKELFRSIAESMKAIPEEKAIAMTATMQTAMMAAEMVQKGGGRNASPAQQMNQTNSQRQSSSSELTINVKFDNDMFKTEVKKISKEELGLFVKEAEEGAN
jgi:hypothetical protein